MNGNKKQPGIAILIPYKGDFKPKLVQRKKRATKCMNKEKNHLEMTVNAQVTKSRSQFVNKYTSNKAEVPIL